MSRLPELDAIRGIAALMVLFCHLPHGFWFGATGVDLFFVLSGFLITGIILRNRTENGFLRTFYIRRALRIFPIYYLSFGALLLLNLLRRVPGRLDGLPYYLTYLQHLHEYWGARTPGLDLPVEHTWSLAIEEQFYLLWPTLLLLLPCRQIMRLCLLLPVLSVILRAYALERTTLLGHMDGLALGGLLACLEIRYGGTCRQRLNVLYGTVAFVGLATYLGLWITATQSGATGKEMVRLNSGIFLISVAYFGLVGIAQAMSGSGSMAFLRWRPLMNVGLISYGLYLYHLMIFDCLDMVFKWRFGIGSAIWLDCLKVLLSLIAAIVSWVVIEKPLMSLKDRFTYGRPSSGVSSARVMRMAGEPAKR